MGLLDNDETNDESHHLTGGSNNTGLTYEDVRTTVREQILAMTGSSSLQAIELQPAPPSYDSSARLLDGDDAAPDVAATSDPENGQSSTKNIEQRPLWQRAALMVLTVCLIFAPFVLMVTSSETGHDPLKLGILALFLVCAQTLGYLLVPLLVYLVHGKKAFATSDSTDPNEKKQEYDAPWAFHFLAHYWLANFLIFWLVMWAFLHSGDDTVAARFDGKITQPDALETLTTCIYNRVPDSNRNATIDDFTFCLTEMGMPKASP